ncbi:hypothetical protein DY000_02004350 [Brassica cretica]|uniref:Uncharacterized protein n=1 Tax=Brassica cretica TaxID=69181 RepID=A0ABQ7C998_BRACR|nr:hypothetical protein DY000_02004350 [Brassica cretica]
MQQLSWLLTGSFVESEIYRVSEDVTMCTKTHAETDETHAARDGQRKEDGPRRGQPGRTGPGRGIAPERSAETDHPADGIRGQHQSAESDQRARGWCGRPQACTADEGSPRILTREVEF